MNLVLLYRRASPNLSALPMLQSLVQRGQVDGEKLVNRLSSKEVAPYVFHFAVVNGRSDVHTIKRLYGKQFFAPQPHLICISKSRELVTDARLFKDAFQEEKPGHVNVLNWLSTLPNDWPVHFAEHIGSATAFAVKDTIETKPDIFDYVIHYEWRKFHDK